jgi:splicing factor U2AF 35 kDa subunit
MDHIVSTSSCRLKLSLYTTFVFAVVANVSDEEMQEHYDNFFEDVFVECEDKYGEIEEMNVCDNLGDHLVGNVYIKVISDVLF